MSVIEKQRKITVLQHGYIVLLGQHLNTIVPIRGIGYGQACKHKMRALLPSAGQAAEGKTTVGFEAKKC